MADKSMGFNVFWKNSGLDQFTRNITQASDKIARSLHRLDQITANPQVDLDTRKADAKVGAFARSLQQRIERAVKTLPDIEIDADSSEADRRIAQIRARLASLADKRIGVGVDAVEARREMDQLAAELNRLSRRSPNIQVTADTARASAALLGVSALASRVNGQNVVLGVNASDVSRAIGLLGLLTAALAAASAAAAPLVAAMAALPALGGAAVQGVGTLATGLSGIGDAVKALSDQEEKASVAARKAGQERAAMADRIASAQSSLARAQEQADRSAIQSARRVQEAREAVADAYEDGARRVASAERALSLAQRQQRDAQENLTKARKAAQEQLEDLQLSLRGAELDEREALQRLQRAEEELAQARAAGLGGQDLEELITAQERAALGVDLARERYGDLKEEAAEAARTGVEGSERVVDAQRRAVDAAESVRDAEADLARAREDAAERVADAQQRLADAQQQSAWAQQDAARAIVSAQRQVAQAMRDTGTAGQAAADKVEQAMEDLSPAGRSFAIFLATDLIPQLKSIRTAVQEALLPDLEGSMRRLGRLTPIWSAGLAETGEVLGDLADKGARMMTSGPWRRDFATIMSANNRILGEFGDAGWSTVDAFRSLTAASLPMVERFAEATARGAEMANQWLQTQRASGDLEAWFDQMGDTLARLGEIAAQIIRTFADVSQALAPFGRVLLDIIGKVVELVGEFAQAHPVISQFAAAAVVGIATFNKIGAAIQGMSLAAGVAMAGWRQLGDVIKGFAPSAMLQRMDGLRRVMDGAALSAGLLTEKWTGSAGAGQRVADIGSKISGAVSRITASLPLLGAVAAGVAIAWDATTTSGDEAADAILRGGDAADKARRKIEAQRTAVDTMNLGFFKLSPAISLMGAAFGAVLPTMDEVEDKVRKLYAEMTPLEEAQSRAAKAARDWGDAVKDHGKDSGQAAIASAAYAQATENLKKEQEEAEAATRSHTDALREQSSLLLGAVDAEIRYEETVDRLTQSLQDNGRTLDLNTAAGRANMSALQDMARAANDHLQAMADQGAAQDELTAKEQEYRDRLIDSAVQAGMTKQAARDYVDQVLLTPERRTTTFYADTGPASKAIEDFINSQSGRDLVLRVSADTGNITGLAVPGRATGGPITGPGTGTSDSILARVSHGEHVWTAREVSGAGGHGQVTRLRGLAAAGALPRFAGGGPVATPRFAVGGAVRARAAGDLLGGLDALADLVHRTTVPALDELAARARDDAPGAVRALADTTTDAASSMTRDWVRLARDTRLSWGDIESRGRDAVAAITGPQFGGLRTGMDQVRVAAQNMAAWVGGEFGRMRALTADPIRWSLMGPINAGLVAAWNTIDRFFALGRPMGPVPVGFAEGGQVPGSGSGDTVPALLTPGEFVVRKQVAEPLRRFLTALNQGQAEAIQAAGGRWARFAMGGTVERVQTFARAQHGKPYIWGGVGPGGYDCSGFQSALTNVAMGEYPYRRRFTTASFAGGPVSGFVRGLTSAYGIGVSQGNPGHMAGTVAGLNVESGGSPSLVKAGPGAAGATSAQFTARFSLPMVGGRFIPGGFDVPAYLAREFAATRAMIAQIGALFGPGNPPAGMTRFGGDAVAGASRSVLGFDTGGVWRGGLGVNLSGRPERVLSPAQTAAFDQLVAALSERRGSAPVVVAVNGGGASRTAAGAASASSGVAPQVLVGALEQATRRAVADALSGASLRIVDDGRQGLARISARQQRILVRQG